MPETKFYVCGQTITLSTDYELYSILRSLFKHEAIAATEKFLKKYDSCGSMDGFIRNIEDVINYGYLEIASEIVDRAAIKGFLFRWKIYDIDGERFLREFYRKYFHLDEAFQNVVDKYKEIVLTQQEEDEYRELKKQFRSRWSGSTIKGAIKAGAMNLASDAWHGFWDSVDKGFSNADADRKKSALYKESRRTLSDEIYASVFRIHFAVWDIIEQRNGKMHIDCLEPGAREKAAGYVNNFADMPKEEVRKIFPKVLLMNPYDEKLYRVLFSLFGDADGGLEDIALYFGVYTPFITEAKEALADKIFADRIKQELEKSEQATLSAKAEYEQALKSNGLEETQSARKNLETIEERLKVYDEKARTIEGEILATRDKVDEARKIIADVEHVIAGIEYSQSESDAQKALKTIENYESKYPEYTKLIAKRTSPAREKIREVLGKFDHEARTITYSVRGKAFTRTFSSRTQAEMARKDVAKIESLLQGLDYAESDTDAMKALHRLDDYRPAMKNVFDDYMKDVRDFASAFDLKARTVTYSVNGKTFTRTFDTREEAEKIRHDSAEIESMLDGLDYSGSEKDAKEALQKLEGYTPECQTIFDEYMKDIKSRLSAFDLKARTITYNIRSKTFTKTFTTRLQAENARSEISKIESLLQGLNYAESETDAKEALQKLEGYTPDFQRVFDDYVKDVKDCITSLDIAASTVDFSGVSVVLDREEAEKVKASHELDEIATSWENYKAERTDGALSRIVGMIQKMPSKIRDVYWGFLSAFENEQKNKHREQENSLKARENNLKKLEKTMKEATESADIKIRLESFLPMVFLMVALLAEVMFIAKYWQGWNWLGLKGIVTVIILLTVSRIRGLMDEKKVMREKAEENVRLAQENVRLAQEDIRIAKENSRKVAEYVSDFANISSQSEEYRDFINSKIDSIRRAAEMGIADAQNKMGDIYYGGKGIEQDYAKAVEWFRKSAEQGYAMGEYNLGLMYKNGYGVEQDYAKAVEWYRKAAERGLAFAQYDLGLMYTNGYGVKQDYAKAAEWFRKAAEQGNANAQNYLGVIYLNGYGVKQDRTKAVEWFRKFAEQGYAMGEYNLGTMYKNGYGVKQDYAKAVEWYRKAAEQGYAYAQYNLGLMYKNGEGVSVDYDEARKWFRKAAEQGHERAKEALKNL